MSDTAASTAKRVRHFRQILLWPLQLIPLQGRQSGTAALGSAQCRRRRQSVARGHRRIRRRAGALSGTSLQRTRHVPSVRPTIPLWRWISPIRRATATRRCECSAATTSAGYASYRTPAPNAVVLSIAHIDLYFFFDIDVTLLNVEVYANDLSLDVAQDILHRFGRAYPAGWDANGQGIHSMYDVEWLAPDGTVLGAIRLARSREIPDVRRPASRTADRVALGVPDAIRSCRIRRASPGTIRYRQIEYYRMPVMAFPRHGQRARADAQ